MQTATGQMTSSQQYEYIKNNWVHCDICNKYTPPTKAEQHKQGNEHIANEKQMHAYNSK